MIGCDSTCVVYISRASYNFDQSCPICRCLLYLCDAMSVYVTDFCNLKLLFKVFKVIIIIKVTCYLYVSSVSSIFSCNDFVVVCPFCPVFRPDLAIPISQTLLRALKHDFALENKFCS